QLGYGNTMDMVPVLEMLLPGGPVSLGAVTSRLEAGSWHSCVNFVDGGVRCWGRNDNGQLGYGNLENIGDNELPAAAGLVSLVPANLPPNTEIVDVALGGNHSCAVLSSGSVLCWGANGSGQLGLGNANTIGDDEVPSSQLPVGLPNAAAQLALGLNHSCVLLVDGDVMCWGDSSVGQLGYGNTDNIGDNESASTPGQVVIGGEADFIHAGTNHTCAILSDETARCWGAGSTGQLGLGNTENVGDDEFPFNVNTLTINADILDIQAGSGHTCALVGAGSVRCWGRNDFGQLGYGNMTDLAIPLTVDLSLGGTVTQLAVGAHHNCALFDDNSVRCWGYNNTGQLGYGSTDNIGDNETPGSVPVVPILPQGIPDDAQINQVALGVEHSCVLYDTGDVICWGANFYGQLGQGTTTTVGDNETLATLQKMELGGDAVSLVLGKHHTCALMSDNGVKCWGRNIYGQLGRGDIANIGDDETPATIDNIDLGGEVTWLTAGDYHTCAIIEEHEILCWGFNDYGQLGYGDTEYRG
ncbi:MAG: hypothetical protein KC431_10245, partial [Myxococcales bacterium]|nr:hypothetical protein [Myxococcales bacterium]